MDDVFDEMAEYFETPNGIIMGDLRADCEFLSRKEYEGLDLNSGRFEWLVGMSADTTVTDSNCAYDRSVFLCPSIPPSSPPSHCP
jgi:deoxyribonuclease-1-like protein